MIVRNCYGEFVASIPIGSILVRLDAAKAEGEALSPALFRRVVREILDELREQQDRELSAEFFALTDARRGRWIPPHLLEQDPEGDRP